MFVPFGDECRIWSFFFKQGGCTALQCGILCIPTEGASLFNVKNSGWIYNTNFRFYPAGGRIQVLIEINLSGLNLMCMHAIFSKTAFHSTVNCIHGNLASNLNLSK